MKKGNLTPKKNGKTKKAAPGLRKAEEHFAQPAETQKSEKPAGKKQGFWAKLKNLWYNKLKKIAMSKKLKILIAVVLVAAVASGVFYLKAEKRERDLKIVELSARASYLNTTKEIAAVAKPHIEKLIQDAEREGMCLIVLSGYRTKERQELIYNSAVDKSKVAYPGTSEHETGLAVDLGGCPMIDGVRNDDGQRLELRNDFETLPEYQWLLSNAAKYGFSQSYTEGNQTKTGKPAESWHWKFKY